MRSVELKQEHIAEEAREKKTAEKPSSKNSVKGLADFADLNNLLRMF